MPIDLPFSVASARVVLAWGCEQETSPHSHQQIAQWCDKFWCSHLEDDPPEDIAKILPILADVDCQWDLFLANSYSIEELRALDFEQVSLPTQWFQEWLQQVDDDNASD